MEVHPGSSTPEVSHHFVPHLLHHPHLVDDREQHGGRVGDSDLAELRDPVADLLGGAGQHRHVDEALADRLAVRGVDALVLVGVVDAGDVRHLLDDAGLLAFEVRLELLDLGSVAREQGTVQLGDAGRGVGGHLPAGRLLAVRDVDHGARPDVESAQIPPVPRRPLAQPLDVPLRQDGLGARQHHAVRDLPRHAGGLDARRRHVDGQLAPNPLRVTLDAAVLHLLAPRVGAHELDHVAELAHRPCVVHLHRAQRAEPGSDAEKGAPAGKLVDGGGGARGHRGMARVGVAHAVADVDPMRAQCPDGHHRVHVTAQVLRVDVGEVRESALVGYPRVTGDLVDSQISPHPDAESHAHCRSSRGMSPAVTRARGGAFGAER